MHVPLPDKEYEVDVRVCDFCYPHLIEGDFFSMLRIAVILLNPGSDIPTQQRALEVRVFYKLNAVVVVVMVLF